MYREMQYEEKVTEDWGKKGIRLKLNPDVFWQQKNSLAPKCYS